MFPSIRRVVAGAVAVLGVGVLAAPTASATPVNAGRSASQCFTNEIRGLYVSASGGLSTDMPDTVFQGEHVEREAKLSGSVSSTELIALLKAEQATTVDARVSVGLPMGTMAPSGVSVEVPGVPLTAPYHLSWSGTAKIVLPTSEVGTVHVYEGGFGVAITPKKADGSLTKYGTIGFACPLSPYFPQVHQYTVLPAVQHADLSATGTTRIAKLGTDAPIGPAPFAVDHDRRTNAMTGTLGASTATIPFKLFGSVPATATVRFTPGAVTGKLEGGVLTAEAPLTITVTDLAVTGIPIVSGSTTCAANTTVTLAGQGFSLTGGGTVAGEYAIPALAGCGPFTALVNALVAGGGNTLVVNAG
jgi:hypothetical protein